MLRVKMFTSPTIEVPRVPGVSSSLTKRKSSIGNVIINNERSTSKGLGKFRHVLQYILDIIQEIRNNELRLCHP
jgi:hypothetical protein